MLSNDDKFMASCGSDKMICIWDLRKAAKPMVVNTESESCIMACDWAADGKHVVSTTQEGMINCLNVE